MDKQRKWVEWVKQVPLLGPTATAVYREAHARWLRHSFPGSGRYWEQRYAQGGTSGAGSYSRLARFKADTLNAFVREHDIRSVIELGCGNGAQLALAQYPSYIGLDVARGAIALCRERFATDHSKSFFLYDSLAFVDRHGLFRAELALSLDVIYHLIEDRVFEAYMAQLFAAATRYVIVYSSNFDQAQTYHERDREFSRWVDANATGFRLRERIENPFPYESDNPRETSKADFYVYEKVGA